VHVKILLLLYCILSYIMYLASTQPFQYDGNYWLFNLSDNQPQRQATV